MLFRIGLVLILVTLQTNILSAETRGKSRDKYLKPVAETVTLIPVDDAGEHAAPSPDKIPVDGFFWSGLTDDAKNSFIVGSLLTQQKSLSAIGTNITRQYIDATYASSFMRSLLIKDVLSLIVQTCKSGSPRKCEISLAALSFSGDYPELYSMDITNGQQAYMDLCVLSYSLGMSKEFEVRPAIEAVRQAHSILIVPASTSNPHGKDTAAGSEIWENLIEKFPEFADQKSAYRRYGDFIYDSHYAEAVAIGHMSYVDALKATIEEVHKVFPLTPTSTQKHF